jgi:hypothetical protein
MTEMVLTDAPATVAYVAPADTVLGRIVGVNAMPGPLPLSISAAFAAFAARAGITTAGGGRFFVNAF